MDYWPCFSPGGELILFSRSTDKGKTWELFVIPSSGGQAKPFSRSTLPVSATRPHWSKKKNLIAFTGVSTDGTASTWTIHADGTQSRQLLSKGLSKHVYYPYWYPDGNRIAVVDFGEEEHEGGVIKRLDLENGAATPLTDRLQVLAGMPSVSPNGTWIAFAGQKNEGQPYDQSKNSIWLLSNKGKLRRVDSEQGRTPSWAPDSVKIAFESKRGNAQQLYAAFVTDRNGKGTRQVTPYELNANHPVWSPDGKSLAFSVGSYTQGQTGIGIVQLVNH